LKTEELKRDNTPYADIDRGILNNKGKNVLRESKDTENT